MALVGAQLNLLDEAAQQALAVAVSGRRGCPHCRPICAQQMDLLKLVVAE
jgi:hypothetical protein